VHLLTNCHLELTQGGPSFPKDSVDCSTNSPWCNFLRSRLKSSTASLTSVVLRGLIFITQRALWICALGLSSSRAISLDCVWLMSIKFTLGDGKPALLFPTAGNRNIPRLPLHYVRLSNRRSGSSTFRLSTTVGFNIACGLVLRYGIGTTALPSWDSRMRWNKRRNHVPTLVSMRVLQRNPTECGHLSVRTRCPLRPRADVVSTGRKRPPQLAASLPWVIVSPYRR
jgi:hypothetical protein